MSASPEVLSVRGLSVTFLRNDCSACVHRIPVLRELSISVAAGEVLAIVGESGAGKSILAHAVLGLLPDNAEVTGDVLYRELPLTKMRLGQVRGRELALVPQSVAFLDPTLEVGKAVCLAARRSGLSRSAAKVAQERVFARLGLVNEVAKKYPCELSGGMTRRVLLAMALVGGARLLIADEPTPGLDPESLAESTKQLRTLANEGHTVLLITHDIMTAIGIADRVAVLREGAIVETAPATSFAGAGDQLKHPYSRALWIALPNNAFTAPQTYSGPQSALVASTSERDLQLTGVPLACPTRQRA